MERWYFDSDDMRVKQPDTHDIEEYTEEMRINHRHKEASDFATGKMYGILLKANALLKEITAHRARWNNRASAISGQIDSFIHTACCNYKDIPAAHSFLQ